MMPSCIAFAFGLTVELAYQTLPSSVLPQPTLQCDAQQFYLSISDVARFLALPTDNRIIIERVNSGIQDHLIYPWLYGTVFSYIMQYHGYLVLHGSAALINGGAVILSGQSGAGKSTLASALVQKGYPFITDDLVVIKQNDKGQYCILPGPAKLRLWKDAMQYFNHDINDAVPVMLKTDKYTMPARQTCDTPMIPIRAFYELNTASPTDTFSCDKMNKAQSLKIIMQNVYRYFMLKPLGKLQTFLQDCSGLSQQIAVNKIIRTTCFDKLPQIIQHIELDQGIAS